MAAYADLPTLRQVNDEVWSLAHYLEYHPRSEIVQKDLIFYIELQR